MIELRVPPANYLELCGLVTPPDPEELDSVADGRYSVTYPACVVGGQSWEGPSEADNASKRLCVGMYALQSGDEWQRDGAGAERAYWQTRALYESRPGLLEAPGAVSVASILIELSALRRLFASPRGG